MALLRNQYVLRWRGKTFSHRTMGGGEARAGARAETMMFSAATMVMVMSASRKTMNTRHHSTASCCFSERGCAVGRRRPRSILIESASVYAHRMIVLLLDLPFPLELRNTFRCASGIGDTRVHQKQVE
jgi:hypothetical protein